MTQCRLSAHELYKLIYSKISEEEKNYRDKIDYFPPTYRMVTFYKNNYNRKDSITLCDMPGKPVVFLLQSMYDRYGKNITLEDFKFIIDMAWACGGKKTTFIYKYYGLLKLLKEYENELSK